VTITLAPMSAEWAASVAKWRYPPPFDVYDGEPGAATVLMDGNHVAILEHGDFVGYACVGTEALVRGGPPAEAGILDVGMGLHPDRVSAGLGARAAALVVETLAYAGHDVLRASVLAANDRSSRLVRGLGFVEVGQFDDDAGRRFAVFVRHAPVRRSGPASR
jgi:L-amino acid N-acyltransferase YncA